MDIITSIAELRTVVGKIKDEGKKIGLVPTMGYLHEGHLSLMRTAKAENDVVIASIFVNPIQFGPNEDFDVYPRDLKRDAALAKTAGVDYIFAPTVSEMYPDGYENLCTFVDVLKITERLCGAQRPGHFRGVATVVSKLFNIVQPHNAYFGQKDAQQVAVIKRMVKDLNFPLNIRVVPIAREADGLAMSSRNIYLKSDERNAALVLSKSLKLAENMLIKGQYSANDIKKAMCHLIESEPLASIDYVEIVDAESLNPIDTVDRPTLVAVAVRIGKTRLIDNYIWRNEHV